MSKVQIIALMAAILSAGEGYDCEDAVSKAEDLYDEAAKTA